MTEITVGDVKDLEAIDIFLFSNGDHNTPPRKYHLNTDSFMMWDDTLKSLGHSHFGSDDTIIDIYTISGHKIEEPSQLIHQAAYVVVKPPASFIQTGYENYLIRATRSWEKRLLKISNSTDSSTKGNTESVLGKSEVNKNLIETQHNGYVNKREIPKSVVADKLKRSLVKPYIVNLKPPQAREKISKCPELKNIQRKRTCFTPQITTLRQRNSPFKITSASKKMLIKTKENFHKKPSDIKKLVPATTKDKDLLNNSHKSNKDNQIFPSTLNDTLNIVENIIGDAELPGEVTSADRNDQQIDNKNNNTTVDEDKTVISNIYKNPEKEYISITRMKYDDATNDIDKSIDNKSVSYAETQYIKPSCTCCNGNCSKRSILLSNGTVNKNNVEASKINVSSEVPVEIQACVNCCETRKQLDHFVAILNNDKILKLHLNLEIKNCSISDISEQKNTKTTHETQAMTVIKTEKGTQVNFYEQLNEGIYKDINKTECFPKHSEEVLKNIIKNDNEIVIINCSCCDCVRLPQYNVNCKDTCNEEILYELTSTVEANRYECRNYVNKQQEDPSPKLIATDDEESMKKTLTMTSVQKLPRNHETNTYNNILNIEEFPKIIAAIDEYSNQITKKTDNIIKLINNGTQTSWCNVMLEARHRADGRYSFHLPSLHKIKNYNIH